MIDIVTELLSAREELGNIEAKFGRLEGVIPHRQRDGQDFTRGMYQQVFEQNQKKGVELFGVNWLTANEKAIAVAQEYNLDIERPEIRALCTDFVLQILKTAFPDADKSTDTGAV